MLTFRYILIVFLGFVFISCHKQPAENSLAVPSPVSEKPLVKLKDMIEEGLPSPYYHFEYNDLGYISGAVFSSGLSFYDLTYSNGKIATMLMNKDILGYSGTPDQAIP